MIQTLLPTSIVLCCVLSDDDYLIIILKLYNVYRIHVVRTVKVKLNEIITLSPESVMGREFHRYGGGGVLHTVHEHMLFVVPSHRLSIISMIRQISVVLISLY